MLKVDILIVGAGVVGLAIAWKLSERFNLNIAVIEKMKKYGQGISSRNSEVIHSGLHYPANMLKSSLCIQGNSLLYEFCEKYGVENHKCGKLIVCTNRSDRDQFASLYRIAQSKSLKFKSISNKEIQNMEPDISAEEVLFLPETGVIDSYRYMQLLYYLGKENGVIYVFDSSLTGITYDNKHYIIESTKDTVKTDVLINAAGLSANMIPLVLGFDIDTLAYRQYLCKGEYFALRKKVNIKHLIYPLPGKLGLGIHLTRDINGSLRLGPNAYYVDREEYSLSDLRQKEFYLAAKSYLPFLEFHDIHPDFTGIRPKLMGPDDVQERDFIIQEESKKGFPGLINLLGIESPGLTASLSIADYVYRILS